MDIELSEDEGIVVHGDGPFVQGPALDECLSRLVAPLLLLQ
jgi:hypothetical protein